MNDMPGMIARIREKLIKADVKPSIYSVQLQHTPYTSVIELQRYVDVDLYSVPRARPSPRPQHSLTKSPGSVGR